MEQGDSAALGLRRLMREGSHREEADAHQCPRPGLCTDIREAAEAPAILCRADEAISLAPKAAGGLVQTSGNVEGHQGAIGGFCTPHLLAELAPLVGIGHGTRPLR